MSLYTKAIVTLPHLLSYRHVDCSEIWCGNCQDYVLGLSDLKAITHSCYWKPLKQPAEFPHGLMAVDIETTTDFEVCAAVCVYQEKSQHPTGGVRMQTFRDFVANMDDEDVEYNEKGNRVCSTLS